MQRDPRAYLWDVLDAGQAIQSFIGDMDVASYKVNAMTQAAVERKFEIIGEALNQFAKIRPADAATISDLPQIVAFRNLLIHGYAVVNPGIVYATARRALPQLLADVQRLHSAFE